MQVHPDLKISDDANVHLQGLLAELFAAVVGHNSDSLLTVELLEEAVTAKVSARGSGALLKHAISNGNEGVLLFEEVAPGHVNPGHVKTFGPGFDFNAKLQSTYAGLTFPVLDVARAVHSSIPGKLHTAHAVVYLTGFLEYMCAEILELAGNKCKPYSGLIIPVDINLAIEDDTELDETRRTCSGGQYAGLGDTSAPAAPAPVLEDPVVALNSNMKTGLFTSKSQELAVLNPAHFSADQLAALDLPEQLQQRKSNSAITGNIDIGFGENGIYDSVASPATVAYGGSVSSRHLLATSDTAVNTHAGAVAASSFPVAGFTIAPRKSGTAASITWSSVEGTYTLCKDEMKNGKPVYSRCQDLSNPVVCWCGPENVWLFSTKTSKDQDMDESFVKSANECLSNPTKHDAWLANVGGKWKPQTPQFVIQTTLQVKLHQIDAAQVALTKAADNAVGSLPEATLPIGNAEINVARKQKAFKAHKSKVKGQMRTLDDNLARGLADEGLLKSAKALRMWISFEAEAALLCGSELTVTTKAIKAFYNEYPNMAKRIRKKGLETVVKLHPTLLRWTPSSAETCASITAVVPGQKVAVRPAEQQNGDADDNMCPICTDDIVVSARGACCSKRMCHVCALRARKFEKEKDWKCMFCMQPIPHLSLSTNPREQFKISQSHTIELLKVSCTSIAAFKAANEMLKLECRVCKQDPNSKQGFVCRTEKDLAVHVMAEHGLRYCKICLDNVKHFMSTEHILYDTSTTDYQDHQESKHPLCGFCKKRFYNDDALLDHIRAEHEECQICSQEGNPYVYFPNYLALDAHYAEAHGIVSEHSHHMHSSHRTPHASQQEQHKAQSEAEAAEYRTDATNGVAYNLNSFLQVYGGTRQNPPKQWTESTKTGAGWSCTQCTFINSPTSSFCETCGVQGIGMSKVLSLREPDGSRQLAHAGGGGSSSGSGSGGSGGGGGGGAAAASPGKKRSGHVHIRQTERMYILDSSAGALIGVGGERIHALKEECGLKVLTVDRDVVEQHGKRVRELIMVGSANAIGVAKDLVAELLDNSGSPSLQDFGTTQAYDPTSDSGFCFLCSNDTFKECMSENLFGSSYTMLDEMDAHIIVGETKIYLYNFDAGTLFGIFVATSAPGHNLEKTAWEKGRTGRSQFPSQVRVKRLLRAKVSVRHGMFQQGRMDPALVHKADQMLGLGVGTPPVGRRELLPAISTATATTLGARSASPARNTKPPSSASKSKRQTLPALPTATENVGALLRDYTVWISKMEAIVGQTVVGANAELPPHLYEDAGKLTDFAEPVLKRVKSTFDDQLEARFKFNYSETLEALQEASTEHEQELEREVKRHEMELVRHKKALAQIAETRSAKLQEAKRKHVNALRAAKATHGKSIMKVPSLDTLRQHVDSSLFKFKKAKVEEERRHAERVAELTVKLATSKRERQLAVAAAAHEKVVADKAAAQNAKEYETAMAKKRAAIQDAEEAFAKLLAAKKAEIKRLFEEAETLTTENNAVCAQAEEQFRTALAVATSQKEMHDRQAVDLASQLSKLTTSSDLDVYGADVPLEAYASRFGAGAGAGAEGATGGGAAASASSASSANATASDSANNSSRDVHGSACSTTAAAAAAASARRRAKGEYGVCGIGDRAVGINGVIWGTIVAEEPSCFVLDSGRMAKKINEGIKWTWEPELLRQDNSSSGHDDGEEWETVEGKKLRYAGVEGGHEDDFSDDDVDYDGDDYVGELGGGGSRPTHRRRQLSMHGGRSFSGFSLKGKRTEKSKKLKNVNKEKEAGFQPENTSKKSVMKFLDEHQWVYVRTGKHEVYQRKVWRGIKLREIQQISIPCT